MDAIRDGYCSDCICHETGVRHPSLATTDSGGGGITWQTSTGSWGTSTWGSPTWGSPTWGTGSPTGGDVTVRGGGGTTGGVETTAGGSPTVGGGTKPEGGGKPGDKAPTKQDNVVPKETKKSTTTTTTTTECDDCNSSILKTPSMFLILVLSLYA